MVQRCIIMNYPSALLHKTVDYFVNWRESHTEFHELRNTIKWQEMRAKCIAHSKNYSRKKETVWMINYIEFDAHCSQPASNRSNAFIKFQTDIFFHNIKYQIGMQLLLRIHAPHRLISHNMYYPVKLVDNFIKYDLLWLGFAFTIKTNKYFKSRN